MTTTEKITEALYEIITGNNGFRDEVHSKWEEEAKRYVRKITMNKNICLGENIIRIENEEGTKTLYTIEITKIA